MTFTLEKITKSEHCKDKPATCHSFLYLLQIKTGKLLALKVFWRTLTFVVAESQAGRGRGPLELVLIASKLGASWKGELLMM